METHLRHRHSPTFVESTLPTKHPIDIPLFGVLQVLDQENHITVVLQAPHAGTAPTKINKLPMQCIVTKIVYEALGRNYAWVCGTNHPLDGFPETVEHVLSLLFFQSFIPCY